MSSPDVYFVVVVKNHCEDINTLYQHVIYVTKDKEKAVEKFNNVPEGYEDKFVVLAESNCIEDGMINSGDLIAYENKKCESYDYVPPSIPEPEDVKISEGEFEHYMIYTVAKNYGYINEQFQTSDLKEATEEFDRLSQETLWTSDVVSGGLFMVGINYDEELPSVFDLPILRYKK